MSENIGYALRLQNSLMKELRQLTKTEGASINQFINVAVAEKIAALRTAEYFAARAKRGRLTDFDRILRKAGTEPPRADDRID